MTDPAALPLLDPCFCYLKLQLIEIIDIYPSLRKSNGFEKYVVKEKIDMIMMISIDRPKNRSRVLQGGKIER